MTKDQLDPSTPRLKVFCTGRGKAYCC